MLLNKLYLEYSQITDARTDRERELAANIRWLMHYGDFLKKLCHNQEVASAWEKRCLTASKVLEENNL